MGRILFLIFMAVPLIEIALFVLVGQAIGLWPTLLGVLVTAMIGSAVVKAQGSAIIAEIRATMARGQLPARSIADGLLVGLGGLLLLLPGYFTDFIGFMLLVPPVRQMLYTHLARHMTIAATTGSGFSAHRTQRGGTIDLDADEWRHD